MIDIPGDHGDFLHEPEAEKTSEILERLIAERLPGEKVSSRGFQPLIGRRKSLEGSSTH